MALSSAKISVYRDKSPSRSPLSPTIIHYRQKYQISRISQDYHREIKRHHHLQDTSRQHHQNRRKNKIFTRHKSPINSLWEIHKSSNGQIYYYNVVTDQSQWEKPPKEQLSSSIIRKPIHSKRTSYNNNDFRSLSSYTHQQSINNTNRTKRITRNNHHHHHHKRRKDTLEIKSSFKKFQKDKKQTDEIVLSTPTSPPANEKIQIDLVDPILTSTNSITNNSISFIDSQQSHDQISSLDSKRSIKSQINEDLSSMINQSSLCPSESTINAILELEHSSPITNLNSDHITRYYRAELIEHLLNWPSTQIERETIRLSNEQIRFTTCQLISLRTDLFSIRLKFERNRFQLLKYHYNLVNQQDLLNKLQLIDSDQI